MHTGFLSGSQHKADAPEDLAFHPSAPALQYPWWDGS